MIITIDGPTASGKSTVARSLAQRYDIFYLNTGFLYRALGYVLMRDYDYTLEKLYHPSPDNIVQLIERGDIVYCYDPEHGAQIIYKDVDITAHLKNKDVDAAASIISSNDAVRQLLLPLQRAVADHNDVVTDGRDCGSVVFPHAEHKFYVTASVEERAHRWQNAQAAKGKKFSIKESERIIQERDTRDATRVSSPLVIPEGAIVVDTTGMTPAQTLQKIVSYLP